MVGDEMTRDARVAFFTALIDDAGLFPPASLPMEEAVTTHRQCRRGEHGWMLARFICPASRLPELERCFSDEESATPWRVSVILDGATGDRWLDGALADLIVARHFADSVGDRARVELLETPPPDQIDVPLLRKFVGTVESAGLSHPVTPFLEVPHAASPPATLGILAELREEWSDGSTCRPLGAKLRCGGASEESFPTPARVASFIHECHRLGVPFKATAGLHHPFRHVDPATGFVQHGFVNILGASVLASAHELIAGVIEEIVSDHDPGSFSLTPERFSWRDYSATDSEILAARQSLFTSYGSCSFSEPVEDLTALGVLPL
jgi:hypothetical protein